ALAKTNDLRQSIHDVLAEVDRARSLDFEGDLATAELCRSAATSLDDPEIEILLAHVLGRVLVQLGRPEEAAEHVARAEQLCRDRPDRAKLSAVIGTRAGLCFLLGRYPEALEAYKEAYDLALEFENRSGAASSALGRAQTLKELRRPQEALDAFRTARQLFQISGEAFWEFQALKHIVDLSEAAAPEEAYGRAL